MYNLTLIEECYQQFVRKIPYLLPEGVLEVDLKFLIDNDLTDYDPEQENQPSFTRYFHVVETDEKITLVNEEFVVWIVPQQKRNRTTHVLIALNHHPLPVLETAFVTQGIYNSSQLVMRILEQCLTEIHENQQLINKYEREA